ncbi:bifunctional pyr operon transcriptional regulator/uracil phosphoribosyltransferase PyrR [Desulfoluna sp.]|uniref:bifunctional pyr operon transcriptional regulator/uracil phosphoribosyltransferase PyrR n=1 Tax=Desulfoluna sp. TaxID=2045199 RepID=UPI00261425E7|nr:bifunctional pyr operon transcriptional regulator/uracil phosphoribosyltransferase PyrR [Desulfoluna sp.]
MSTATVLLDATGIKRAITRMAHEIIEHHRGVEKLALIGIQTRGVFIARRLRKEIEKIEGMEDKTLPCGEMDINLYRDDWTRISHQPIVKPTEIPFEVNDRDILLVDDVLYTGRTIRAAMDALMDFGRPARINLAVLVDRGHREFPIQPDYTGKKVENDYDQHVNVLLSEHDTFDQVTLD